MSHEEAFIRAFIPPQPAERYRALLRSARGRGKFRACLAHALLFDRRLARAVAGADSSVLQIDRMLRALGAPDTCYCISERNELDGRELPLSEALALTVGQGSGTILSCVPGVLAYYEAEDKGARFILHRVAA